MTRQLVRVQSTEYCIDIIKILFFISKQIELNTCKHSSDYEGATKNNDSSYPATILRNCLIRSLKLAAFSKSSFFLQTVSSWSSANRSAPAVPQELCLHRDRSLRPGGLPYPLPPPARRIPPDAGTE